MSLYGRLVKLEKRTCYVSDDIRNTLSTARKQNALFRDSLNSDDYDFLTRRYDSALKGDFPEGKAMETVKDIIGLAGVVKMRKKMIALDMYRPIYRKLLEMKIYSDDIQATQEAESPVQEAAVLDDARVSAEPGG